MNTNLNGGSATIYQFPAGGRDAVNARKYPAMVSDTQVATAAAYDSWYHDEAIRDSQRVKTAIVPTTFPRH